MGVLTCEYVRARIELIADADIEETPIRSLVVISAKIAFDLGLTVYDALCPALARQLGVPFVTADQKLLDKARSDPGYAGWVIWVADLA
jgi:predicted nucleic acid-binding protein